jgi:tRNA dimethylallyltransferase
MAESSATIVFIAGPTASGKSAAALEMAQALGGEIVNADSMQVYRDLRILTARPSPQDLERARHHLFGHVDAATSCSAGMWARQAAQAIADIAAREEVAIVVGGTGLYFRALSEGLSPVPEVPNDVRAAVRRRCEQIGSEAFRAELLARDPAAARLSPADVQRHIRAAEVLEATGRPLAEFQSMARESLIPTLAAKIVIEPDRETLYRDCDARFDRMLAAGALEEARAFKGRALDPSLPAMKALGVAELVSHLQGQMTLADAAELAKRNTRRFAKRQLTWFRNQTPDWPRASGPAEAVRVLERQLSAAAAKKT